MDRKAFFDSLKRNLPHGRLTVQQVDGIEAILDACIRHGVTDLDHVAHILAHVRRETGGYMLGIKETVMPYHTDKTPSDATVIARLDKAWADGKLGKVSKPYWRDGAFGRGAIQITHWDNYEKFGKRLGVPLRARPELALDHRIGADIAVVGMKEGLFRQDSKGKNLKLSDFRFPEALTAPPDKNPRRIVNGKDGSDAEVAASHRLFATALRLAGHGEMQSAPVPKVPPPTPAPVLNKPREIFPDAPAAAPPKPGFWARLFGRKQNA